MKPYGFPVVLISLISLASILYFHGWIFVVPLLHGHHLIAGVYAPIAFFPIFFRLVKLWSREEDDDPIVLLVYSLFLTLFVLSLICFVLLTFHLLYAWVLQVGALVLILWERKWWETRLTHWVNHHAKPFFCWLQNQGIITVIVIIALFVLLMAALLPPLGYDAHEYHLAVPQTYLQEHQWVAFEWNVYAAFPMNVELLYLWSLAMNSVTGCTVINFIFAGLTALALVGLCLQILPKSQSLIGAMIFLSTGIVIHLVLQANIDLALAASTAVLFLAYERYRLKAQLIDLVFIGLAIGFALGSKYIALLSVLMPFLVVWLVDCLLNRAWRQNSQIMLALLLAGLLFAPWLGRNWVLYQNPFYPLLANWFGGQPEFFSNLFVVAHAPKSAGMIQLVIDFVGLPLQKTIGSQSLPFGFSATVLIGMLIVLSLRRNQLVLRVILFGFTTYLIWFCMTQRNDRFLASLLPLMALLPVMLIQQLQTDRQKKLVSACLMLFVCISLWAASSVLFREARVGYLLSAKFEEQYFVENLPHYRAIDWLNQRLDEGRQVESVLFVGEAQTFGARFDHIAPTVFNHHPLMHPEWQAQLPDHITHVLYNGSELDRLRRGYGALGWGFGDELAQWIEDNQGQSLVNVFDAYPEMPERVVVYQVQR